jgi:hypothetical protein
MDALSNLLIPILTIGSVFLIIAVGLRFRHRVPVRVRTRDRNPKHR